MRTIKFRAKTCKDDKWVYGSYLESNESWHGCKPHKSWIFGRVFSNGGWIAIIERYPVKDDTVGQFTGLTDINGNEIYEGDIVKVKSLKGVVTWHPEGYFCIHTYKCDIADTSYNAIGDLVDWLHREHYADGLEIIGNIYDNPELMEGGRDD